MLSKIINKCFKAVIKNEDPAQQNAYNQAVAKALDIVNDRPTPTLSNETVQKLWMK